MTILTILTTLVTRDPVSHVEHEVAKHTVGDPGAAQESTYFIARTLMKFVEWILNIFGLEHDEHLFTWLYVIVVFLFSMILGYLLKWITTYILNYLDKYVKSPIYSNLVKRRFFLKLTRFIPALLFLILIQFTLYMHLSISSWLTRLSLVYIIVIVCSACCTVANVIWDTLDARENKKKLPLRGVIQVIKLIIWIVGLIIIAATLFNKSPGALLAGLGAFAAVLMLIFKDSILGIVAGVQLAENDSLHVGDWIEVPGSQANGIVSEVSLTDVKIINWDKTVSTVPPYQLISGGFRNYRNMQESQTRRIQRSYLIDADSVIEGTPDLLDEISKIPLMKDWIDKKREQQAAGKVEDASNSEGLVDGSIATNLGMFRAYITLYLRNNLSISQTDDLFVTTLEQTANGIPLQIYCFTTTSAWIKYEAIQASIFEHLAVMLYKFHLYVYEGESGRDSITSDYLAAGKSPAPLFGLPYPFFLHTGTPLQPGIPPTSISRNDTTQTN